MIDEITSALEAYAQNARQQIPDRTKEMIDAYVERGELYSDFLAAVLYNNLAGAFMRADDVNIANMYAIVKYLYNEVPENCWGSVEKVDAYVKFKIEERQRKKELDDER